MFIYHPLFFLIFLMVAFRSLHSSISIFSMGKRKLEELLVPESLLCSFKVYLNYCLFPYWYTEKKRKKGCESESIKAWFFTTIYSKTTGFAGKLSSFRTWRSSSRCECVPVFRKQKTEVFKGDNGSYILNCFLLRVFYPLFHWQPTPDSTMPSFFIPADFWLRKGIIFIRINWW